MNSASFKIGQDVRTGRIVHIDEVEDGFQYAACPDCHGRLVAANLRRNTRLKATYFRHSAETSCTGETLIHRWAKQVIADRLKVSVPEWISQHRCTDVLGRVHHRDHQVPGSIVSLSKCQIEASVEFSDEHRRPDLVIETDTGQTLCIEIHVHNAVNQERAAFYGRAGLSCFEIDLSSELGTILESEEAFADHVVSRAPRAWVSCTLYSDIEAAMKAAVIAEAAAVYPSFKDLRRAAQHAITARTGEAIRVALPRSFDQATTADQESSETLVRFASSNKSIQLEGEERTVDIHCMTVDGGEICIELGFSPIQDGSASAFYRAARMRAFRIDLSSAPKDARCSQEAFQHYVRESAPREWLNREEIHSDSSSDREHEKKGGARASAEERAAKRDAKAAWRLQHGEFLQRLEAYLDPENRQQVINRFNQEVVTPGNISSDVHLDLIADFRKLPELLNIQVEGELAFRCHRCVWQWSVYRRVVIEAFRQTRPFDGSNITGMRLSGWHDYVPKWTPPTLYRCLMEEGVPLVQLCIQAEALAGHPLSNVREQPPGLLGLKIREWRALPTPIGAIRRYLGMLTAQNILHREGDTYMLQPDITPPLCSTDQG